MMIDLHSHILPKLDDGSQSLEESLEMARNAVEDGIRTLIATPHHANGKYDNEITPVIEAVDYLNGQLSSLDIPLTILPGQEVRVYDELLNDFHDKKISALNHGSYMLIEFPSTSIPDQIEELLHELRMLHIIPIIAHPERNREIAEHPERLRTLIEAGALSQITTHSIVGSFGVKIQSLSIDLCKRNLVHFVASDAHNLTHRPFKLREAYHSIDSLLGTDYGNYYKENAQCVIDNRPISVWTPIVKKKKWYQFRMFFG